MSESHHPTLQEIRKFVRNSLNSESDEALDEGLIDSLIRTAHADVMTERDWPFLRRRVQVALSKVPDSVTLDHRNEGGRGSVTHVRRIEALFTESPYGQGTVSLRNILHEEALSRPWWDNTWPLWWSATADLQESGAWNVYVWPWTTNYPNALVQHIVEPDPWPTSTTSSGSEVGVYLDGERLGHTPVMLAEAVKFSATALAADFLGDERARNHARTAGRLRSNYADSAFPTESAPLQVGAGSPSTDWPYTPFRLP